MTCHHKNLVGFVKYAVNEALNELHLYMEFCGGGDLQSLITKYKNSNTNISESKIWKIAGDISSGLAYMHDAKIGGKTIIHRDIKPDNVLIDTVPTGKYGAFASGFVHYKLGDFGLAREIGDINGTFCGTPGYLAPELIDANNERKPLPSSKMSDVFALGRTLELTKASQHSYSAVLSVMIQACLRVQPDERPTATQIVAFCNAAPPFV